MTIFSCSWRYASRIGLAWAFFQAVRCVTPLDPCPRLHPSCGPRVIGQRYALCVCIALCCLSLQSLGDNICRASLSVLWRLTSERPERSLCTVAVPEVGWPQLQCVGFLSDNHLSFVMRGVACLVFLSRLVRAITCCLRCCARACEICWSSLISGASRCCMCVLAYECCRFATCQLMRVWSPSSELDKEGRTRQRSLDKMATVEWVLTVSML